MDKKLLRWNFIFQYGWVLTNIFNSILLLPIYLKKINSDTLGLWLATGNILGWMLMADPGVGEVLQQKIAELNGRKKQEEIGTLVGSGIISSGVILALSLIVGYVCYFFVGAIIKKDISNYPHLPMALIVSVLATGMSLVSFSLSGMNQGLHNSAHVAIASLSANFLFLFLNILFLYMGLGVLSIALANLCRAVFINLYNWIALMSAMKKLKLKIEYHLSHLRSFVKIFTFTSASKIISNFSYSIEMIALARFISPSFITMYEINKRPINISYSLIGRHSVALMPLLSHAKGGEDHSAILNLIKTQFRFYAYASLFAVLAFYFNYENLITVWTGKGQYAGNLIIGLLVGGLFFSLISYFMAIVGYALGDIKMNSIYNVIRNILYGGLIFLGARYYGIKGTLTIAIIFALVADTSFYGWRLKKIGYFDGHFFKSFSLLWTLILPLGIAGGWLSRWIVTKFLPEPMYFVKLITGGMFFTLFFVALILSVDKSMRSASRTLAIRYIMPPINRLRRA